MEANKLYNAVQKTITLADGREIMIETDKLAKQADGSVVVRMGDTMLLGIVVAAIYNKNYIVVFFIGFDDFVNSIFCVCSRNNYTGLL